MKKKYITLMGLTVIVFAIGVFFFRPIPPDHLDEPPVPRFGRDAYPDLPIDFFSWKDPDPFYTLTKPRNWEAAESSPSFPLSEDILDYQYVRLSDELLILVEKEDTELQVDNFFIINPETGEKLFFTGSFVVPSRLNLDKEILVYAQGHVLILEDNEGKLWQLDVMY